MCGYLIPSTCEKDQKSFYCEWTFNSMRLLNRSFADLKKKKDKDGLVLKKKKSGQLRLRKREREGETVGTETE